MVPLAIPVELEVALLRADAAALLALSQCLSPAERERAGRFAFDRDRRRYIEARARLRDQLGLRLGVAPAEVEIAVGRHGKPALGGRQARSHWRFNVSHCEGVALYAFAQAREVGVDVEALRALQAADDAAVANFSPLEQRSYAALPPGERAQGFFNCWTRKEAFVKALGCGLRMPLQHFDVSLAPGEPARLLRVGRRAGEDCGWQIEGVSPLGGFVAAVAVQRDRRPY